MRASDGSSAATVQVQLFQSGLPIQGAHVQLAPAVGQSAPAGLTIAPSLATTDLTGIATFQVTAMAASPPITLVATDTSNGVTLTQTAQVSFAGAAPLPFAFVDPVSGDASAGTLDATAPGDGTTAVTVSVGADPIHGGNSFSNDQLVLLQGSDTPALGGGSASVGGLPLGAAAQPFTADGSGNVAIAYIAPTVPLPVGDQDTLTAADAVTAASVTATDGYASQMPTPRGGPSTSGTTILTANPQTVPADGASTATVTATVYAADGTPLPHAAVLFSATPPGTLSVTAAVYTDATGIATDTLAATAPGTASVSATVDGIPAAASVAVTFTAPGGSPGSGSVSAWPQCTPSVQTTCWSDLSVDGHSAASLQPQVSTSGSVINLNMDGGSGPDLAPTYTTSDQFQISLHLPAGFTPSLMNGVASQATWTIANGILTLTAQPTASSWTNGNCAVDGPCGTGSDAAGEGGHADVNYAAMLLFSVEDLSQAAPTGLTADEQVAYDAFVTNATGMSVVANAQAGDTPVYDPMTGAFRFRVVAPHYKSDGTTVNTGAFAIFMPAALLRNVFHLTGTVAGGDFQTTINGAPATVSVDATGTGVLLSGRLSYSTDAISVSPVAPVPVITAISPATGAPGSMVTIAGTGFTGATAVAFGQAVARFTVVSSTEITATVPQSTGTVDVTVTGSGGASATAAADQFTYTATVTPAPTVMALGPATGAPGSMVTITGTGFMGATAVDFGAVTANFTGGSPTKITAVVPQGTGTLDVTVTGPGGTSAIGGSDRFTFAAAATPALLTLTATPPAAPVGQDVQITAKVLDGHGHPVADVPVTFSASGGTLGETTSTTDADGKTTVLLSAGGRAQRVTVTASGGGVSGSTAITFTALPPVDVTGSVYAPSLPVLAQTVTLTSGVMPGYASGVQITPATGQGGTALSGMALNLFTPSSADGAAVANSVYASVYSSSVAADLLATVPGISLQVGASTSGGQATFVGPVINIQTSGLAQTLFGDDSSTTTNAGIDATLPYNSAALAPGQTPQVFWLDASQNPPVWTNVGVTVLSFTSTTVTVLLPHLSLYTVIGVAASTATTESVNATPGSVSVPSAATVTATVLDQNGQAMSGVAVAFTTTLGSLSAASATTDAQGHASTTITSASAGTATATVTATVAGIAGGNTATVTFTAASPVTTTVQVTSGTSGGITATVLDQNGRPMSGVAVAFTSTLGTLSTPTASTNAPGEASVTLTSTTAGTATVIATAGGVSGRTQVTFTAASPVATTVHVTSGASGGITATVLDQNGEPMSGVTVAFTSTLGTPSTPTASTNAQGEARLTLTSTTAGTATVIATAGGASGRTQVTLTVVPPVGGGNSGGSLPAPSAAPSGVGAAGGLLTTTDGTFFLDLPAGALAGTGTLAVAESVATRLPAGMVAASALFGLTGAATASAQVATIRYDAGALGGLPPDRLSVYARQPDGTWRFLPTKVDAAAGSVSVHVSGPVTLAVLADTRQFSDVPAGYWAAGSIDAVAAAGVVDGLPGGTFSPDAAVTRAQLVKMLILALGLSPAPTGGTPFGDVASGAWYAPYVAAAVQNGLVQGVSAAAFGPDQVVTREQAAVLLARALHLRGGGPGVFTDGGQVDAWAAAGVEAAVQAGYLRGFPDGTFQPARQTTRAQAAALLAAVIAHMAP